MGHFVSVQPFKVIILVDLGMENKIKNIEETEAARLAAIEKSLGNKRFF